MGRHKLLVVDDEEPWRTEVESILQTDYDVACATDPEGAIALVTESAFSLAILDQRISADQSGIELLQELRQIRPGLRAIILTGYAALDDAVHSMKQGALDYISKGQKNLAESLLAHVANAIAEESNREVQALLDQAESHLLEFKSSARFDLRQNKMTENLEAVIVKTAAGFLNSEEGGVLLIGVDDAGQPIGLAHDYQTVRPQNRDGYERFLTKLLLEACGRDLSSFIRIDFPVVEGHEICRVTLRPAPHPIFVRSDNQQHFYLRAGNSTNQLLMADAFAYSKTRWTAI
ncbi:MAG: hypothetical protein QOK37_4701 [Thermoanaerobaculia bacterium]|jgi:ActR/RegA family two-component response regulator|nr:hypothetical protein [Thermoanaerobaculia bacterium]